VKACMPQEAPPSQRNAPVCEQFPPIGAGGDGCYGQRHELEIER
jgi:hypothetical protein